MLSRLLAMLWGRPTVPPYAPPNPCPVNRDALYGLPNVAPRVIPTWQPRPLTKTVYIWHEGVQRHIATTEVINHGR